MSASESRSAVVLQLAEEFLERYRQGRRPSLKEYIDRHPELATEIKEVFPAMALMENVALDDESLAGAATGPETGIGAAPPEQLGDYRILREVGRGGMGIVYEAEQVSLGRHVALKVLPRKVLLDEAQKRRFEREAKAAAKLHHTNIVPIFGVGEHDGLPYYVMQFIQGLGLNDVLDELKRMQGNTVPGGELRVSRKDVPAADVARSLLTGAFPEGEVGASASGTGGVSPPSESQGTDAPRSEESATGKLSDSYTLSTSRVVLPGGGKSKKATYWQSVAHIGVQVADALEYAHKQGIVHRDIKPSNLLLDTAGTVWVTDFGLARAENEDHLTQTGDIVGTLRYMPPEAFEGHTDKRGDIYSLGLTLYELLALQPAFEERERHRLIKRVTTEEPAPLEKLNRAIPRDLVTIVHKAIDREPSRRYATARDMAADLQHFLDDEPIQARPISSLERLVRWCRHHPGVATLTAILVLFLVGVTVASLLTAAYFDRVALHEAQAAENERLARLEADEARKQEITLRQQAENAKQQSEQQRLLAETNFAKARKAVDDYFTAVSESQLLKVPGMQPLRRELLQSALTFYQDFLKERGDDSALRGELAAAYLRVGKIHAELDEGDKANKAYERARQLYEELTEAMPESVEWRHGLAQCLFWLGRLDEAIALWEKLVQPDQRRFRKELAEVYNSRAVRFIDAGELTRGLQDHQQALTLREMLVRLNPNDPEAHRDLGGTLNNLGWLLDKRGRNAEALPMYRRAAERAESAFAQAPQVILNGRFLTIQINNVADVERRLGHTQEALAAFRRVAEVWRRLAQDNPAIPNLNSRLWAAYRNLALYQRELKQTEGFERTMRLARGVIERLPSDGAEALFNLACVRAECAAILGQGKDKPKAEEQAEIKHQAGLAMEALSKAIAAGFGDLDRFRKATELNVLRGRFDFRILHATLATRVAFSPSARPKAGQQDFTQRLKPAKADPSNERLRADLAAGQHALALIQLDNDNLDEAHKRLQQAIALREALVQNEPTNAQYQADLAASRFALGDYYWTAGRLAEGARFLQQELRNLEGLRRAAGDGLVASDQLLTMRRIIARHYAEAGLWSKAHTYCGQMIQLPEASEYDYFCASCLALLAGDAAAYRNACETMVKRFGEKRELYPLAWIAWGCVLADNTGIDPAAAIRRARMMSAENSPNNMWQYYILGLAHYRAGRFSEAVAQASKSDSIGSTWASRILNWPVLALAHHRLGHATEAKQWLEKSKQEWRRLSPLSRSPASLTILPSTTGWWRETWHDWLLFEILFREASLVITGSPSAEDAYHHVHRSLISSRLGDAAQAETEWQSAVKIAPREPMIWLARVHQFVERKRNQEAEDVLAKVEAFQSVDPHVWKECGRLRFALGQTDKAAADFRKTVELLGGKIEATDASASGADKLFAQVADNSVLQRLTAAVQGDPEDASKRWQRGEWYAGHRRWKEAAADFQIALERKPPNETYPWLHAAPALVAADDREGYRRLCRQMRKRFDNLQDPMTCERLAKVYLLFADADEDTEWAGQLADHAATQGKNDRWTGYFVFCKGLADYRRGNYRAILDNRNDLLYPNRTVRDGRNDILNSWGSVPDLTASNHLVVAMAYHWQGDAKAAREYLAQAAKLVDQHLPDPDRFPALSDSGYHHDWLIAWLLYREAKTLIEGKKTEPQK